MSNINQKPDNNLVWAILSTLFCCLPLGVVAIVNASKVDSLWYSGEHDASKEAAANAKKYVKWSAWAGIVLFIIVFVIEVAVLLGEHSSNSDNYIDVESVEYADSEVVDDIDNSITTELSVTDIREVLEEDVRKINNACPIESDNGVIITSVKMIGEYIVYNAECDEDIVVISAIKLGEKLAKKAIIKSLQTEVDFIELLKKCDVGLKYKYVGKSSGDVCIIKIESDEL